MPHYNPQLTKPMRDELTSIGFKELRTSEEVDAAMEEAKMGLTLVAVNAVNGAAAGHARPGVHRALADTDSKVPDRLLTVFPGDDVEAGGTFFGHIPEIPPSDPSFALFKDGELVYFLPLHRIEGRQASGVAEDLKSAFEEFGQ
ncbi:MULTISPECIES: BrxA/BrxB family bacilliredoxin [unclassified Streptomyces]|uniref:BrxA/BrxB family bacilliredoxin n=1 Tax=Streptomyces sp. NPDC127532 TaxID=3345399 RepID=UPI003627F841